MLKKFVVTTQEHKHSIKVHLRSQGEYLDNGERKLKDIITTDTKLLCADRLKDRVLEALASI